MSKWLSKIREGQLDVGTPLPAIVDMVTTPVTVVAGVSVHTKAIMEIQGMLRIASLIIIHKYI